MRVFALSDIHVDYDVNARWVSDLSRADYQDDVLILAGDVSDVMSLLDKTISTLAIRFKRVLFVPGNHDLWVLRERGDRTSFDKFDAIVTLVESLGASMQPFWVQGLAIIPLFSWYDYSFGLPGEYLRSAWMDYRACRWPPGYSEREIAAHFLGMNEVGARATDEKVITFSHFLPRIDLMPHFIPESSKALYPVLGSAQLDRQIRSLASSIHVYGHSHVNRNKTIDGVNYVNNAFGYPSESLITAKRLRCVHEI